MSNPGRATILAVDDHALNLELLKQDLSEAGYSVVTARSGEAAIEAIRRHPPNLVLLDIMMPGLSGLEVLRSLRRIDATRNLPIILVTAKSGSQDVVEGLRAGANDYVTKPIDVDVLIARMETHLRLKALQDELEARNERIRRDLLEARRVQLTIMPDEKRMESTARSYGLRIAGYNQASALLGGDFWDLVNLADGSLGVIVADFAGHGVIPALNTFRLKTFLHSSCASISNPGLALARINAHLVRDLPDDDYATCLYGCYSSRTHQLSIAVAGHPHPLVYRRSDDRSDVLRGGGQPVGLFPEADFSECVLELKKGDVVLFHSDGLPRRTNPGGEEFSSRRVMEAFETGVRDGASAALDRILHALRDFTADSPPSHDTTMVLLEVLE